MKILCLDCLQGGVKREAEFIVFLDSPDQMHPVCAAHFDDYERSYGEDDLNFFTVGDMDQAVQEANRLLSVMRVQLDREIHNVYTFD